jgi:hypothetical protein
MNVTIEDVRKRVEKIRQLQDDPEEAHALEDQLRQDVLEVIAEGEVMNATYMRLLATEALATKWFGFPRLYA